MSTLTVSIDKELEACAYDIELAQTSAVWQVIAIGKALSRARDLIREEGTRDFAEWCQERVKISKSGAYRAIQVYDKFGERPTLGRLEVAAAYALAMDSVPEEARQQAIEESQTQKITGKRAKEIVDGHAKAAASDGVLGREVGGVSEGCEPRASVVESRGPVDSSDADDDDAGDEGSDREDRAPVPRQAKASGPVEPNVIGGAIRQVTQEFEYVIESLADFQVAAVFEGVAVWMAGVREQRGIK